MATSKHYTRKYHFNLLLYKIRKSAKGSINLTWTKIFIHAVLVVCVFFV